MRRVALLTMRLPAAIAGVALVACTGGDLLLPGDIEPAALRAVTGDGQRGRAGEWLQEPVVVAVADAAGQPVAGVAVAFTFAEGGVAGVVEPAMAQTDAEGRARAEVRLGTDEGTQVVVAAVAEPPAGSDLRATFRLRASEAVGGEDEKKKGGEKGGD